MHHGQALPSPGARAPGARGPGPSADGRGGPAASKCPPSPGSGWGPTRAPGLLAEPLRGALEPRGTVPGCSPIRPATCRRRQCPGQGQGGARARVLPALRCALGGDAQAVPFPGDLRGPERTERAGAPPELCNGEVSDGGTGKGLKECGFLGCARGSDLERLPGPAGALRSVREEKFGPPLKRRCP